MKSLNWFTRIVSYHICALLPRARLSQPPWSARLHPSSPIRPTRGSRTTMGRTAAMSAPTRSRPAIHTPTRRSRSAASRAVAKTSRPSRSIRAIPASCSAARTTTAASTTAALPREPSARSGSATIARRTAARASSARSSRAIPTTVALRSALADPDGERRRPSDRVGRARTGVLRLGELGRPGRNPKTFGDVFVARFRNPGGPERPIRRRTAAFYGTTVVAHGSSAPNLLGVFHDKTQSRPTAREACAMGTSTSRGRASPATGRTRSTSSARPTTASRSARR